MLHGFCCLLAFSFCLVNIISFLIKIFTEELKKCKEIENISKEPRGKLFINISLQSPSSSCPHFLRSHVRTCLFLCPPQIFTVTMYKHPRNSAAEVSLLHYFPFKNYPIKSLLYSLEFRRNLQSFGRNSTGASGLGMHSLIKYQIIFNL